MIFEKIKELCEQRGVTLYKLEKDCGLSVNSIMKWDNSIPKADNLAKIADYFNVSVDYLLGRTDDPTPKTLDFERVTQIFREKGIDISKLTDENIGLIAEQFNHFVEKSNK